MTLFCFWCLLDLCAQFYRIGHVAFPPPFAGDPFVSSVLQILRWGHFLCFGALAFCVHSSTDSDMWRFLLSDFARFVSNVLQILTCGIFMVWAANWFVLTVLQVLTCGIFLYWRLFDLGQCYRDPGHGSSNTKVLKGSAWDLIVNHNGKLSAQYVLGAWCICVNSSTDSDMWRFLVFGAWSICANRVTKSDIWRFPMSYRICNFVFRSPWMICGSRSPCSQKVL